ncbi:MAG TPA: SapC family protein [Hyphomonadaceae bacterium]|nr:SapC family protein [Hyphomonadaceae bacterium]
MSTPMQGGQPELSGNVMFYRRPEPLSLERHRNLGVKQIAAPFSFLREAHAVPITVSEFGVAATCYPIIFVGADKTPVAVMGVRQNENEYVDAAGQPDPDTYIPAFARRYPFVFASDPSNDKLLLCVDTEAAMVSNQPDVAFFEGDKPSKFTDDAIEFCKEFERQRRATLEFVEMLDQASLFEQKSVAFTPRDAQGNAGPTQKIADYWAISEEGLNALPDGKFQDIRNTGALAAIYAHMVSLMNWQRVIQRTMRRLQMQPPAAN